ncbi:MAG: DUF3299 domain-containing protein [Cyanobacteria bacterium P01_F01_bin.150]
MIGQHVCQTFLKLGTCGKITYQCCVGWAKQTGVNQLNGLIDSSYRPLSIRLPVLYFLASSLKLNTRRLWNILLGCFLSLGIILASGTSWPVVGLSVNAQTLASTTQSAKHQIISWKDLRPPEINDFDDPYADLTPRQLLDLAELSRIEWGPEHLKQDSDGEESQRLRQRLEEDGLDVEWLLSQIERVTNYYTQQATDTNPDIDGQYVKLHGYVLPLTQTENQVSDFLLVPFIGACVHVPPPLPNQMIYVDLPQDIDDPGLFAKVWLEGIIYPQSSSHEFFRVDGERQVDVSYTMKMASLSAYKPSTESVKAPFLNNFLPEMPMDYSNDYPLWQRIQVQTSAIFTQAMVRIKTQGVWQALPLGLFIAFGYGVLHTLGPGHGKAVIVSYFIGKDGSLLRGVIMGIRIAIFHVISAIAVVILAHVILQQTIGNSADSYQIVRLFSYASIAIIGGWMLRKSINAPQHQPFIGTPIRSSVQTAVQPMGQTTGQTATSRSLSEALIYPSLTEQVLTRQSLPNQGRSLKTPPTSIRGFCGCLTCGDRGGSGNWLSVAVGAVPCSGALLVLLYGLGNNLLWPSVLMVLAISLGMAITLSAIGVVAIWGQNRTRYHSRLNLRRQRRWSRWGPIVGASSVCLIGLFMLGFTLASAIVDFSS